MRTIEDTDESNETFYLYVADFGEQVPSGTSGNSGNSRNRGTGTIIDDDDAPAPPTPPRIFSVSSPPAEEGGTLRFTVRLDRDASETTTYYYATYYDDDATATGGGVDYVGHRSTPLVFRAGDREKTIPILQRMRAMKQDLYVADFGEQVPSGTSGNSGNIRNRGTGTIIDDDDAPAPPTPPRIFSVSSPPAEEGGTLRFTVRLDRDASETTTYYYATYR